MKRYLEIVLETVADVTNLETDEKGEKQIERQDELRGDILSMLGEHLL